MINKIELGHDPVFNRDCSGYSLEDSEFVDYTKGIELEPGDFSYGRSIVINLCCNSVDKTFGIEVCYEVDGNHLPLADAALTEELFCEITGHPVSKRDTPALPSAGSCMGDLAADEEGEDR